jgi:hypothetical protein
MALDARASRPGGPESAHCDGARAWPGVTINDDAHRCREHPARSREQDPVACGEPGAVGLATQHPKLMPQHQDLQVLGAVVSVWEDQQAG